MTQEGFACPALSDGHRRARARARSLRVGPAASARHHGALTNYQMVAGKWAGPVTVSPEGREQGDWVELTIRPDRSYDFNVARTIGMFGGKGMLSSRTAR